MKRILLTCLILLFVSASTAVWAQDRTVSGKVTDASDGSPLPGVSVLLKGTTSGVPTDIDGNYSLTVPASGGVLVFNFLGYTTQEIEIGNRDVVSVQMQPSATELGEVVVVGYGTQSKELSIQSISVVNSENISGIPLLSPQEALQGQAAGVQMVTSSGLLGAAPQVRIRGVASFSASTEPLYVIDGVPLNNTARSTTGGGSRLNPLADINNDDIESISILKDASAIAIYGSRGANGVVLINTKQGKNGKTKVDFNYYTGWSEETYQLEMMNATEFQNFRNDIRVANGAAANPLTDSNFDWPSAILQTGRVDSYTLSASGGDEKTTFFVSGAYLDQSSYAIGNEIDRISGRLNLTHRINDKVRFGVNASGARTLNDRINSENSTFAPFTSAFLQNPTVDAYNEDGSYTRTGFVANVIAIEDLSTRLMTTRRLTGNAFLEAEPLEGLVLKTDIGIDQLQTEQETRDPDIVSVGGYAFKRIDSDKKWVTTTTGEYNTSFGKHNVGGLVGMSYEVRENDRITVEGSGFVADGLPNVGSASTPSTTSSTGRDWALYSWFSRLNYNYDNKYLFEFNFRRDGSTRFGSNTRFGNFWAASAGWRLIEESFIKSLGLFDDLKLSVSYGISGNDNIGLFSYAGLYAGGTTADYAGNAGLIPNNAANPDLGWEETSQLDVTLNASLLDSRLNIEASYYDKRTDGLLLDVQVPYTTGFATISRNIGEIQNTGIDLSINSVNIKTNDFTWETTLNIGYLKNEVLSLPDENVDLDGRNFQSTSSSQRAIVGESVNTFFLIRYVGVNPQTGDAEWLDRNRNLTTAPTADDRVVVGSAIPDISGGFRTNFKYKDFDLSAFFSFISGSDVFLSGLRFTDNPVSGFNKRRVLLNYWEQPGDNAYLPALTSTTLGTFSQRSTAQLQNGSYVRLRNVTLGYNIPSRVLSKTKFIRSARIYVMGQNLWTIKDTDFEPEVSSTGTPGESFFTMPQARTITIGAKIGL